MNQEIINPEKELEKIEQAIRQYEVVAKSSVNRIQKKRAIKELRKLKDYRVKLFSLFDIKKDSTNVVSNIEEYKEYEYLAKIFNLNKKKYSEDHEINNICILIDFFDTELMPILSERRLKLNFKYAIERDEFYNSYQKLQKNLGYITEELKVIRKVSKRNFSNTEIRNRYFKMKRVLMVEVVRYFRRIEQFTKELLDDIEAGGLACLNYDDILEFEVIEGEHILSGHLVKEAITQLYIFTEEIIEYINLPEIIIQEQK